MAEKGDPTSTIPSVQSGTLGWESILRWLSVGLTLALVLLGAVGFLGVRTVTERGSARGYTISVTHASVTRPGLATPFIIGVEADHGRSLPSQINIRVDARYLEMFDENGLEPDPSASFQSGEWVWWTFDVPPSSTEFRASFDARLEPAVQWGSEGSATLEVDGQEMTGVTFRTWVMP